jgi:hypothetical protein
MVNTYQPINSTALEILSLMRDQAEYDQATISSTAIGNALSVKRETAARNMRTLVDMNLLEVIVPQKGALAATYRIPAAAAGLLDALNGVKNPVATRLDEQGRVYEPADGVIVLSDGVWDVSSRLAGRPLHVRVCGRAEASVYGNVCAVAADYARLTVYRGVEAQGTGRSYVRTFGGAVHLYGHSVGVSPVNGAMTATDMSAAYVAGTTVLDAYDQSTWHATDTAVVCAGGRSRGTLSGRATAFLMGEAVARASWYASVLLDGDAIAEGGEQVRQEDISSSKGVLELYGAVRGGKARLYKVLPGDCVSGKPFNKPTEWGIDSDVECDEWLPDSICEGGLFLYATLAHAAAAAVKDEVIVEVTADPTDVFSMGDGVVKARRVHVVEELRWKW